ncbi:phosphate propanoyltransferase [Serpentinicella sp. ANB-PHB4]|uniref:phosphate propanoyltransferase n=1 Tax=Serpentinicella sp. ANB-PHB4 TaxID=3074076 RepID=UPI0028541D94|nr:phosphate propanoyltransferase [Serpentinicella sp. ANB-PHB4]MDR5658017.1 phosphate propanoyltransferase [Serpentinicella sp. ANB-PHB4]
MSKKMIPIALSNRHMHLSQEHIEILFGEGYELTKFKDLSQPGQFAAQEKVDVEGPKGTIKGIRVLGPARNSTQLEISLADGFVLGINPPVRDSGDIAGSPGAKLIGPKGEVVIEEGIIAAARHIHMGVEDAEKLDVVDKERVQVKTEGERALIFENVLVRVNPSYDLEMHVDVDEGNAAGVKNRELVELIKY